MAAERFVDFPSHNAHIIEQRVRVEHRCQPIAKRIALSISDLGLPVYRQAELLEQNLNAALERTVRFGYREAQTEIRAQRAGGQARERPRTEAPRTSPKILAQYVIPDAGRRARVARTGLAGIHILVRERAHQVAQQVVNAATTAATDARTLNKDRVSSTIAIAGAAQRALHNSVLELVGEALNLGRTAGALESNPVPEFALRSEQLDSNTCDQCEFQHGEIYRVGSDEFFTAMPPAECLGGGRCRGIYVFE